MNTKLFLDDFREPWDDSWAVVRSYDEFVAYLNDYFEEHGRLPDEISFDHDLHPTHYPKPPYLVDCTKYDEDFYKPQPTGLSCAKYFCGFLINKVLVEEPYAKLPVLQVHSKNHCGAVAIAAKLETAVALRLGEEIQVKIEPYG